MEIACIRKQNQELNALKDDFEKYYKGNYFHS